jgi:hypothetical protein
MEYDCIIFTLAGYHPAGKKCFLPVSCRKTEIKNSMTMVGCDSDVKRFVAGT